MAGALVVVATVGFWSVAVDALAYRFPRACSRLAPDLWGSTGGSTGR